MAKQHKNLEILHGQVGPYVKGEVVSHEELVAKGADLRHLFNPHRAGGPAVRYTDKPTTPRSEAIPPLIPPPEFMHTDEPDPEESQIEEPPPGGSVNSPSPETLPPGSVPGSGDEGEGGEGGDNEEK